MPGGPEDDWAGFVVGGRYELVSVIGSGGMGTVWRARDRLLDRPVAAKVITTGWNRSASQRTFRERSLREAQATARINHPNVVRVYDYVEDDDRLWIVMELLDARSLDTILEEDGPLSPQAAAAFAVQIVRALRVVHAHGVVHRDVKPGNVLIEADGHAVLTDFGIASLEGTGGLTNTGAIVGSPEFMAPERIESEHPGPASDLWSLGVTLCAAVTGASPFRRATPVATMHAIVIAEPEVPYEIGPLAPLVHALFRRDPALRPDTTEVEARLVEVLAVEALRHTGDPTRRISPLDPQPPRTGPPPDVEPEPSAADVWQAGRPVDETIVAGPRRVIVSDEHDGIPGARVAPDDASEAEVFPRVPAPPEENRDRPGPGRSHAVTYPLPRPAPVSTPEQGRTPGTRDRRAGGRRRLAIALPAVTLAVAGAVIAAVMLTGSPDDHDDTGTGTGPHGPASSPQSGPATPGPAADDLSGLAAYPTTTPAAPPVPVRRTDEGTFSWRVPTGWTRTRNGANTLYTDPADGTVLTGQTKFSQVTDLLQNWRPTVDNASSVFREYRQIAFEERNVKGRRGVVWEYTWLDGDVRRHAIYLAFLTGAQVYVEIDLTGTEQQWARNSAIHAGAVVELTLSNQSGNGAPGTVAPGAEASA